MSSSCTTLIVSGGIVCLNCKVCMEILLEWKYGSSDYAVATLIMHKPAFF
ncbi:hypothetical protein KP509_07G068300 [Ceratopteris richardii]|uniref:Uncharacterized protein n=1 Tax=Ceratopteris richardii TaxID=49495 RepID=A0A8T2UIR9_CERRI|nr:hypothetical protein KP509_07G068300 [Ceratopteris richardii]